MSPCTGSEFDGLALLPRYENRFMQDNTLFPNGKYPPLSSVELVVLTAQATGTQ